MLWGRDCVRVGRVLLARLLLADGLRDVVCEFEVCVDLLDVLVVFEGVDEFDEFLGVGLVVDADGHVRDHGDGCLDDGQACGFDGFFCPCELGGVCEDDPGVAGRFWFCDVVGAGFDCGIHDFFGGGFFAVDDDLAAGFEDVSDGAGLSHVSAVLAEEVSDVWRGS